MQILSDRIKETSNISVSSNVVAYPVSNLSIDKKSSTWKSNSNSSQTISITWDSPIDLNCVSLVHHNFHSNSVVKIKYYDLASNVNPIYDSGNISVGYCFSPPAGFSTNSGNSFPYCGGNHFVHQSDTFNVEKIEIIIDGDTPDGFYEIARVIAGNVITFDYGAESASISLTDESESIRTESGDVIVNNLPVYKNVNLSFGTLTVNDRNNLINIFRKIGSKYPALFFSNGFRDDSIDKSLMIYGRIDSTSIDLMQRYYSATSLKIDEY